MLDREIQLRESLLRLMDDESQDEMDHPSVEQLLQYQSGQQEPSESDLIQEHLVSCSLCRDLLLDLRAYPELPEPDSVVRGITPDNVDDAFQRVWSRVSNRSDESQSLEAHVGKGARSAFGQNIQQWVLAACLALSLVGSGLWISALNQKIAGFSQPRIEGTVTDLFPLGDVSRGTEETEVLRSSSDLSSLVLILHIDPLLTKAWEDSVDGSFDLELEIFGQDENPIWRRTWTQARVPPTFAVSLPASWSWSTTHRLTLEVTSGGRSLKKDEYRFRVALSDDDTPSDDP